MKLRHKTWGSITILLLFSSCQPATPQTESIPSLPTNKTQTTWTMTPYDKSLNEPVALSSIDLEPSAHLEQSANEHPVSETPDCNNQEWLTLTIGGEEEGCFIVKADGYVEYQGQQLSPPLNPYSLNNSHDESSIVYISPLSPSGRYAILRVFGFKAPGAVIDLHQGQLFDTINPLNYGSLWVEWGKHEHYAFMLHPDDGGGFDGLNRIDLRSGEGKGWDGINLLNDDSPFSNDTPPYYTLDEQTFRISEDGRHFSIQMAIYENRHTASIQQYMVAEVDIETMETIRTSILD